VDSPLRRSLLAAQSALALALLSAAPLAATQGPPAAVRVDAVRSERLAQRRSVTGDVRAAHRVAVAAREKGLVEEVLVDEGDAVEAGAVLARLDSTQLALDLEVLETELVPARATVDEREAEVRRRRSDLEALVALVERRAANPKELVEAESQLAAAEARLQVGRAMILIVESKARKLRRRLEDMEIRAPFAGTVVATSAEVGGWLGEGASVAELVSSEQLEVWLDVPQDLYASTVAGPGPIQVRPDAAGEGFELESYRIVPEVTLSGRTFRVIGAVPAGLRLASGMSVVALVPTAEERDLLTVHRDAVLRNEVGPFVYGVLPGADGEPARAAPVPVEVLFQTSGRAVVRSGGLRPGMQVVIEGNERLYPMAPIRPVTGEAPAGGGEPGR
jgi:RND family efflux transporter MFP subunit